MERPKTLRSRLFLVFEALALIAGVGILVFFQRPARDDEEPGAGGSAAAASRARGAAGREGSNPKKPGAPAPRPGGAKR
jgi:hypothetical protein